MDQLIARLMDAFSVGYMFCVIAGSYMVIRFIDHCNGTRKVPTWQKRCVTCVIGALFFVVFREYTEESFESLLTSFFASLFVYDSAIKWLLKKLNSGYKC